MSTVTPFDANYRNVIDQNLNQTTEKMKTGAEISNLFSDSEEALLKAWTAVGNFVPGQVKKDANGNDVLDKDGKPVLVTINGLEAEAHVAEQKYRRISRIYEGLQQMIKNADETARRVINNMGFR